jgi:PKD repeat protein
MATSLGDTVRFRLQSAAADLNAAAGYRIVQIVPRDLANTPPRAVLAASITSGPAPLRVRFAARGSNDPRASQRRRGSCDRTR